MSYASDLENKVKDYLDGDYVVEETETIPSVKDVTLGKKAKKMRLCAYCIDMRKSSELLTIHEKQTCGKIHKAFLTIATKAVLENGGNIRSFNGDGLLAFWPAKYQAQISPAIKAAMQTKYLMKTKLAPLFAKYSDIDFGIGIDHGDVYIVRAGLSKDDDNNDLVFLGNCVNFATAISNKAKWPGNVEISEFTYNNLENNWKYGNQNGQSVDMWTNGSVEWKGKIYNTKFTSWHSPID